VGKIFYEPPTNNYFEAWDLYKNNNKDILRIAYDPESDNLDALTLQGDAEEEPAKPATEAQLQKLIRMIFNVKSIYREREEDE
jgi:hypothetical protein